QYQARASARRSYDRGSRQAARDRRRDGRSQLGGKRLHDRDSARERVLRAIASRVESIARGRRSRWRASRNWLAHLRAAKPRAKSPTLMHVLRRIEKLSSILPTSGLSSARPFLRPKPSGGSRRLVQK